MDEWGSLVSDIPIDSIIVSSWGGGRLLDTTCYNSIHHEVRKTVAVFNPCWLMISGLRLPNTHGRYIHLWRVNDVFDISGKITSPNKRVSEGLADWQVLNGLEHCERSEVGAILWNVLVITLALLAEIGDTERRERGKTIRVCLQNNGEQWFSRIPLFIFFYGFALFSSFLNVVLQESLTTDTARKNPILLDTKIMYDYPSCMCVDVLSTYILTLLILRKP